MKQLTTKDIQNTKKGDWTKKNKYILCLLFVFLFVFDCREVVLDQSEEGLSFQKGILFYKSKPFTGKLKQENPTMEEETIVSYKNGLEDGEYIARKKSGQLLEKRYFKRGAKQGIHRSWFPNGNNRLYSEFAMGNYINDRWE